MTALFRSATVPSRWHAPLAIWLLSVSLLVWAQWDAASGMASFWWRNDTFAHALLVFPIALWLAWRQRARLASVQPQPWWPGLLLVALAALLGALGWLAKVNVVQHFAVVLSLQAITLALLGLRIAKVLAFPLAFLWFAPPFGEFLMDPMMEATADFTVAALRLTGIPVFREGQHFVIPSGNWSVVEACSGLRYLIASFMVGTLFAYLNFGRWWNRIGFMGLSLLVPIVANWLRAYLIVMTGHLSGNQLAVGADHLIYGWVFFGFIMLVMFWLGARWADREAPLATPGAEMPQVSTAGMAAWWHWSLMGLGLALALAAPARWAQSLSTVQPVSGLVTLGGLNPEGSWVGEEGRNEHWAPTMLGADERRQWIWRAPDDTEVTLDVGFYFSQRDGAKAINGMNFVVRADDERWARERIGARKVDGVAQESATWLLRAGAKRFVVRRLYWVDGEFTASERQAKWLGLRQLMAGRGDAAAIVVWMTPAEGGDERADAFWRALRTPLSERLRAMSQSAARTMAAPE